MVTIHLRIRVDVSGVLRAMAKLVITFALAH